MALVESPAHSPYGSISTCHHPSSSGPSAQRPAALGTDADDPNSQFDPVDLRSDLDGLHIDGIDALSTLQRMDTLGLAFRGDQSTRDSPVCLSREMLDRLGESMPGNVKESKVEAPRPFQKWMRSLQRRAMHHSTQWTRQPHITGPVDAGHHAIPGRLQPRKSSSGSSFGFVAAVRSASASLASVSAVARSKRTTARSHCPSRTDRSSRASISGSRVSEDSSSLDRAAVVDVAVVERSLQRRRILEELINTEEGYIGDIRFLMNVYITILASLPTLSARLRSSINQNLAEIVELHEGILGDLHRAVPHSEYTQLELPQLYGPNSYGANHFAPGHRRWTSLDAVPEHSQGAVMLHGVPGMVSEPQVAAEVSKIFSKKMNRFFIYKEYGAKYELMIKDVASAHKTMPDWESYQRGLEALASTVTSAKRNEQSSKKSLTIGDLLVKPIQRVCRYPLLFAELLKYTPVTDCPNSHMEVESALMRLREATAEINRATNDARMRATLERTWLLQDRLVFPNRQLDAASKNRIRSFGHVRLCGSLYVCWQTNKGVDGKFLICLLYRDILCLAAAGRVDPIYTIQACINLNRIRVEEADNGRGLQCHTAPFSWKLVFECDHHLYEILMSACSPKEEMEWRTRLNFPIAEDIESRDSSLFGFLDLEIKSLGTVFGKPGTMARRMSIHRATTVGPKSPLCQVVLKNTSAVRDSRNNHASSFSINRSQSLLTTNHRIPVLAPARGERARLEAMLADVWSRDVLPFPGMISRSRSEHIVRSSASTVMRKLSVASIASTFSRKSGSIHRKAKHDENTCDELCQEGHGIGHSRFSTDSEEEDASHGRDSSGDDEEELGSYRNRIRPRTADCSRRLSRTEASSGFKLTAVSGTPHQLEAREKTLTQRQVGGKQMGEGLSRVTALRASSASSLPLTSSAKARKYQAWPAERDVARRSASGDASGHSRWARVGLLRNEARTHGFRNLFR